MATVPIGSLQEFRPTEEGIAAYLERVELYFQANDIAEANQVPVFLTVVGGKVYALLRDLLAPDKPDSKSFGQLAQTLRTHYEPKPLVIAERSYFHSRNQKATASIAEYVAELRRLATHCEFGDYLDDALRDRLVCGLLHSGMQRRLLSEANLSLAKAMEIAQGMEAADHNAKKLKDGDTDGVHRMGPPRSQHKRAEKCYRCGSADHAANVCRFRDATCHKCHKKGHIAKACRGGRPKDTRRPPQPYTQQKDKLTTYRSNHPRTQRSRRMMLLCSTSPNLAVASPSP